MEDIPYLAATAIGLFCIYKSKQRRFQRANEFGVEVFTSYFAKLTGRLFDEALLGFGLLLLAFGSINLALKYAEDMFWLCILIVGAVAIESRFYSDRRQMNHVKQIK